MSARDYFKEHGYDHCKEVLEDGGWLRADFRLSLEDLVERYELVQSYGGITKAKQYCEEYKSMGSEETLILFSAIYYVEELL